MDLNTPAEEAYAIIDKEIIPEALLHFRERSGDYSGNAAFLFLGTKGQFSDINRKFWKLHRALWLGQPLKGEQPDEILRDLIGHCLLTLYCYRYGEES